MRIELTPALILHRRAWRDTSMLVEAFTRMHGRVGLVAKGARRARSRWRGVIEPLAALELSFSGRGDLYTLTGAEATRRHVLTGKSLMAGFYAAELVMRLVARDDPHPLLYDSLVALLGALDDGAPAVVALRFFERDLLDGIGYGIPLTAISDSGEAVTPETRYVYDPGTGLRRASGRTEPGAVEIAGSALIGLVRGRFQCRADVREARALMQAAITPHLGDRPLKSVVPLQAMQQFASTSPVHNAPAEGVTTGESE